MDFFPSYLSFLFSCWWLHACVILYHFLPDEFIQTQRPTSLMKISSSIERYSTTHTFFSSNTQVISYFVGLNLAGICKANSIL